MRVCPLTKRSPLYHESEHYGIVHSQNFVYASLISGKRQSSRLAYVGEKRKLFKTQSTLIALRKVSYDRKQLHKSIGDIQ